MNTVTWLGPTNYDLNGSWDDPSNWAGDALPGPTDDVVIPGGPIYTVTLGDGVHPDHQTIGSLGIIYAPFFTALRLAKYSSITIQNSLTLGTTSAPYNYNGAQIFLGSATSILVAPGSTFTNDDDGVLSFFYMVIDPNASFTYSGAPITTLNLGAEIQLYKNAKFQESDGTTKISLQDSLTTIGGRLYLVNQIYKTSNTISFMSTGYLQITNTTFSIGQFGGEDHGKLSDVDVSLLGNSVFTFIGAPIRVLESGATIGLSGTSIFQARTGKTYTALQTSLKTIAGQLNVGDRDYTTSNNITVLKSGYLDLTNCVFTSGLLTSYGDMSAIGSVIDSSLIDYGTIFTDGQILTLTGASDVFYGKYYGNILFSGGAASFRNFASIYVLKIDHATVTFDAVASLEALNMSSGSLTANKKIFGGLSTFTGGVLEGTSILVTYGGALANLTIGGTATLENKSVLTQSGGDLTLGDSSGGAATLLNASSGTYDIADDSDIALGDSPDSAVCNLSGGLFEKTGGTGTSVVAPDFVNRGVVAVGSGVLDFADTVWGAQKYSSAVVGHLNIEAGATMSFGGFVAPGQELTFVDANGTLRLDDAKDFHALIDGFRTGETIDLAGFAIAGDKFRYTPGVGADGYLLLASGSKIANLHFAGDYHVSEFQLASDGAGGTWLTVAHS